MFSLRAISLVMSLYPLIVKAVVATQEVAHTFRDKPKEEMTTTEQAAYNQARQDAALNALKVGVEASETVTHKDIFNDTEVEAFARTQIDAVKHGLKMVNKKTAHLPAEEPAPAH